MIYLISYDIILSLDKNMHVIYSLQRINMNAVASAQPIKREGATVSVKSPPPLKALNDAKENHNSGILKPKVSLFKLRRATSSPLSREAIIQCPSILRSKSSGEEPASAFTKT